MSREYKKFLAATCQLYPVYGDTAQTTEKVIKYIREAAKNGAKLIVFPEVFIPGYPNTQPDLFNPDPQENYRHGDPNEDYHDYWANWVNECIEIPGRETDAIGRVAKEEGVHVVSGCNEIDQSHGGDQRTFNAAFLIGPDGRVIGKHRKVTPVVLDRTFWSSGGPEDICGVWDTELGKIGVAFCFEHLNMLYLAHMIALGQQIHCALWSSPGPKDIPHEKAVVSNVIDVTAKAQALIGGLYTIISSFVTPDDVYPIKGKTTWTWYNHGCSGIVNPFGMYVAGPVYGKEEVIYGEIDFSLIVKRRLYSDQCAKERIWHLLNINVNPSVNLPIEYRTEAAIGMARAIGVLREPATAEAATHRIDDLAKRLEVVEKKK